MPKKLRLLPFVAAIVFACNCWAQPNNPDTLLLKKQLDFASNTFNKSMGEQSKIYNGIEYAFYGPTFKHSPYFMNRPTWKKGTVMYNYVIYKNVPLLYDTYKDLLVLQHYNGYSQFSLYAPRVQSFDLYNHHFIYIDESTITSQLKSGFYDELYNGKLSLLAKRETGTLDSITSTIVYKKFEPATTYYIKRDNKFYKVKSRGDVTSILKDHKKDIIKYIKDNNIDFAENKEQALIMTVSYYEQISK